MPPQPLAEDEGIVNSRPPEKDLGEKAKRRKGEKVKEIRFSHGFFPFRLFPFYPFRPFYFFNHPIMARSFLPTSSMGCSASWRRRALNTGRRAWFSRIHSLANSPVCTS